MSKITKCLVPLVLVVVPLALAACGGDDDGGDAPTKKEFIAQADEICGQGDDELAQEVESTFGDSQPSRQEAADFASDVVVPNIQGQLDDLRDLTPPEGDEETLGSLWDTLQSELDQLEAKPETILTANAFEEANSMAQDYGFESCGGT